jgi:hypothetical protein
MKLTMEDLNGIIKEVLDEISLEKKFESLTCQHEDCAKKANHFIMTEKKKKAKKRDKCYYKVKARYDVWPSAYASGALVKCRRVGAKNWGNKSK